MGKDLFDEKLRSAKLARRAKPFKCSKCLSEFMKKAQLKSHQCFKCDLCNKYFKVTLNNQSFYKHDMDEHDGFFTKKSKSKRPLRERKNINRYQSSDYEEKLPKQQFPKQKGVKKQNFIKCKGHGNEQNTRKSKSCLTSNAKEKPKSEPKKAKVDYKQK